MIFAPRAIACLPNWRPGMKRASLEQLSRTQGPRRLQNRPRGRRQPAGTSWAAQAFHVRSRRAGFEPKPEFSWGRLLASCVYSRPAVQPAPLALFRRAIAPAGSFVALRRHLQFLRKGAHFCLFLQIFWSRGNVLVVSFDSPSPQEWAQSASAAKRGLFCVVIGLTADERRAFGRAFEG